MEFPDYKSENGATVFWQVDLQGKIRTGKIMLYNRLNCKRIKDPFSHIHWVHKEIKQPDFVLRKCLFGEHLLQDKTKPIAIVESEKTAIIASMYLPQFIWLATGSLTDLNAEKCIVLKGRTVTLFPDLNGFEKWSNKAKELSSITKFTVSDLLEQNAQDGERKQGLDLADYLINLDYLEFVLSPRQSTEHSTGVQPSTEAKQLELVAQSYHFKTHGMPELENWDKDIAEMDKYFESIILPIQPIKLNKYSTIMNVSKYIESHLATVKTYKGERIGLSYFHRLQELKLCLISMGINSYPEDG